MQRFLDIEPVAGFPEQTGLLLAALQESTRQWRDNLGQPKIEAVEWQPWPGSHSIGALILHMVECEVYWLETFVARKRPNPKETALLMSDEIHQYGGRWPKPPEQPLTWYYDLQDTLRARTWEAIRHIEPMHRTERKEFVATLRWVVAHVVHHDSYHGGQAVLLHEMWKAGRRSAPASEA